MPPAFPRALAYRLNLCGEWRIARVFGQEVAEGRDVAEEGSTRLLALDLLLLMLALLVIEFGRE
jgi:hypothetical protein